MSVGAHETACSTRPKNLQGGHAKIYPMGKKKENGTYVKPLQSVGVDRPDSEATGVR